MMIAAMQALSPWHTVGYSRRRRRHHHHHQDPPPTQKLKPPAASSNTQLSLTNPRIYYSVPQRRRTPIGHKPCGSSGSNDQRRESFLDENGAVEDMDGYLNYLSLEYDSVWDTKPSWCQPWTIISTGVIIIAGSWLLLQSLIVTSILVTLISAWWYIFLFSYPKAYSEMIADRRQRVTRGLEDTYGLGRPEAQKAGGDARRNAE